MNLMNWCKRQLRDIRRLHGDAGQAVVVTVFALFFFALVGALSLDAGIYVNDRRDAQNVVDKAALAGALELTLDSAATGSAEATAKASEWAANNGIDLTDPNVSLTVSTINTCFSANDPVPTGVQVTLQREAASVFLGFVPVTDWDVNAHAIACAGRPIQAYGFLPFAISETGPCFQSDGAGGYEPIVGERCLINSGQTSTGSNGQLGFDEDSSTCEGGNSSASVLREQVEEGVSVTCTIGDVVAANQGSNVGAVRQGLGDRFVTDGMCESAFTGAGYNDSDLAEGTNALNAITAEPLAGPPATTNGRDDFYEVWLYHGDPTVHPAIDLEVLDCDAGTAGNQSSSRNGQLVVVHDWSNPDGPVNNSYIVRSFARAYVEGCERDGTFYPDCDQGGGPFDIYVRFVEQVSMSNLNLGLDASYGEIQVFLKQ